MLWSRLPPSWLPGLAWQPTLGRHAQENLTTVSGLPAMTAYFGGSPAPPERTQTQVEAAVAAPSVILDEERASSVLSQAWELGQNDKRGTFVVRTYQPNFFLPVHYTSHINRSPSSPTHAAGVNQHDYQQNDAKLQISLRAKVAENFLLPGADLWFAYTQRSL